MTTDQTWKFYGRNETILQMKEILGFSKPADQRFFSAIHLSGQRLSGKSHLISKIMSESPSDMPFIHYTLPSRTPGFHNYTLKQVMEEILNQARKTGLDMDNLNKDIREYQPRHRWRECQEILIALLIRGVVIILEDFENARDLDMARPVKYAIDSIKYTNPAGAGSLVLMDAYYRNMNDLLQLEPTFMGSPTINTIRLDLNLTLQPHWSLRTVMKMASDYELISSPSKVYRFLTLWTIFGGQPHFWHRYCTDQKLDDLDAIKDTDEWRQNVLKIEKERIRNNQYTRFDSRALAELLPPHRELFIWIAMNCGNKGVRVRDMVQTGFFGSEDAIRSKLDHLSTYHSRIEKIYPLGRKNKGRWVISDNYTLFQQAVYPELMPIRNEGIKLQEILGTANVHLERLLQHETQSLMRLAAAYFRSMNVNSEVITNVWQAGHVKAFDVMSICRGKDRDVVWLGATKHNDTLLEPREIRVRQNAFMQALSLKPKMYGLRRPEFRRVLIAPWFSAQVRQKLARERDFIKLDIPEMARTFGFKPDYIPEPDLMEERPSS